MSIDLNEFYQTFFDEADELLNDMEQHLLAIDPAAPDSEQLNAIFRAAHSIKGGAGTFGFSVLQETTHLFENLLDQARHHELNLDPATIDIFLETKDMLSDQLNAYRQQTEPDAEAFERICAVLKKLAEENLAAPPKAPADRQVAESDSGRDSHQGKRLVITGVDAQTAATLIEELALFGTLTEQHHESDTLSLRIETGTSEDDIRAVLCFLVEEGQLRFGESEEASSSSATSGAAQMIVITDIEADMAATLTEELALFGRIDEQSFDAQTLRVRLETETGEADLRAVLCFVVDDAQIKIERSEARDLKAASVGVEQTSNESGSEKPRASDTPKVSEAPENSRETTAEKAQESAAPAVSSQKAPPSAARSAGGRNGAAPAAGKAAASSGGEAASLRVSIDKIDQIINLVGELVITQSMLEQGAAEFDPVTHGSLLGGLGQLQRNARDLQEAVMSIRMVPMDVVFNRFPRLVRDLAGKLNKKVDFETVGKATELDKGLVERIVDPLTHLVRNSLDHGIETPERRIAAGKPETGRLVVSASHQGGNILIEISDDGGGLNREKILAKARQNGLSVSDAMSDDDVWQLIFAPGFSTSEQVTDLSGRGVGMDVVKRNIAQMGGHVDIQSAPGQGTRTRIVLPLTLAILDGMSVRVGEEVYILPLGAIQESMQVTDDSISTVAGSERVLYFRGEYLPLVELWRVFDIPGAQKDVTKSIVMVVQSEGRHFALQVDQLVGQHQVVVKNLETNYRRVPGISAATILGDGSVALILDVPALSRATQARDEAAARHAESTLLH